MFKPADPYTFRRVCDLTAGGTLIGSVTFEYMVTSYDDLMVRDAASIDKAKTRQYLVSCTQRINIFNATGLVVSPIPLESTDTPCYKNYPVMISTFLTPTVAEGHVQLVEYSPHTVNTVVQSSGTSGISASDSQSSSVNKTVGSTTSQTNSYGAQVNISETPGVSLNYEHASTTTHDRQKTTSNDSSASSSSDSSSSASMSVKDWGSYALVNQKTCSPTWLFGQEYPWSAIDCRMTDSTTFPENPNQVRIVIPETMAGRLWDNVSLYPPSELAMFGINFLMKAQWLASVPYGKSSRITVASSIHYYTASHSLVQVPAQGTSPNQIPAHAESAVYIDKGATLLESTDNLATKLDMALMALHPLGFQAQPSVIGFIPAKYTLAPAVGTQSAQPVAFQAFAASNTLLAGDTTSYPKPAVGAGFNALDTVLNANFTAQCQALEITAYFKVADVVGEYVLRMKHWYVGTVGAMLTFTFNNDNSTKIIKFVDDLEGEGGENNLLVLALRSQDFGSTDYHDYLQLGLNSVAIKIEPIGGAYAGCGYQLRAMSIERG